MFADSLNMSRSRLFYGITSLFFAYILYGTIVFWGPWTKPPSGLTGAEGLHFDLGVVFTGGPERIEKGMTLLQQGVIDTILISSLSQEAIHELSQHYFSNRPLPHILETKATSTHGNAYYTKNALQDRTLDSIVLITHSYHMERSYRLLWLALRGIGISISCYPIERYPGIPESELQKISAYRRLIIAEKIKGMMNYVKFLYNGTRVTGNNRWENTMEQLIDTTVFQKILRL